jgi:hypothetical protein
MSNDLEQAQSIAEIISTHKVKFIKLNLTRP